MLIGFLFYLFLRPQIILFSFLNIKCKTVLKISDNLFINSFPQFLSCSILFFIMRLITHRYNTKLVHQLLFVLIINWLTEFIQFFLTHYATPDFWDILFGSVGAFISYLLSTNSRLSKVDVYNFPISING